jgi:arylsulfatase A-like enzyme
MRPTIAPIALGAAAVTSVLSSSLVLAAGTAPQPPNIVLIMTDDQGYGDLGITGNPVLRTPNIDAFAQECASIERFYVSPVSTPTRACLMTGRYNFRTRAIDTWIGRAMLEPDETTMAELLRDAGYRTGIFGKWHLGDCYPMRAMDQGFHESLVHRGGGLAQPSEPLENNRRYTDVILFHNGEQVQTTGYCTDVYFDAALEFIEESQSAKKPFFVYLPTNAPHGPFHDVPQAEYEHYRDQDLAKLVGAPQRQADSTARIFAMEENIDSNVGRLLSCLDEHDLASDTIVVYLHDNGPQMRRYNAGLRGTKSQVYEGGIRSPLLVRWPGHLPAGRTAKVFGAHIDLLPTLLEAAGVGVPEGLTLDGRSLLPALAGDVEDWPERHLVLQAHRGDVPQARHNFAVLGQRWKLLRASGFGRESAPPEAAYELYDLKADPGEERDLAEERPKIVARLTRIYDAWFADVSSTRPDNYAPPRIVLGTDHERTTVLTHQDWRRTGAGGGWGPTGRWLLRFEGEQSYDITFLFREKRPVSQAVLRLGERLLRQDVGDVVSAVKIEDFQISEGEAALEVWVESEGEELHAYQVEFVRH